MKEIKYRSVVLIVLMSVIISLLTNYLNPDGLSLIRQRTELEFETDTLLFQNGYSFSDTLVKAELNIDEQLNDDSIIVSDSKAEVLEKKKITDPDIEETNNKKTVEIVESFKEPKAITLQQAVNLFNQNLTFIDARESNDYDNGHIKGAINIPYYEFEDNEYKLNDLDKDSPVITYCSGTDCDLSILLGNQLYELGFKQVYIFFGGWPEWQSGNHPATINSSEDN